MSTTGGPARPRRRQARGERRISEILDAAAAVFAELGYDKATTNAIAAAAGISPGSLYQFFANKTAIAQALADRFVAEMRAAHEDAFDRGDLAEVELDDLLDRIIDPIVAFNVANPGFKALFARPDMPAGLAAAAEPIQAALVTRIETIIAQRASHLPAAHRHRTAVVGIQIFQALIPLVVAADERERPAVTGELKKVLRGYLGPIIEPRP